MLQSEHIELYAGTGGSALQEHPRWQDACMCGLLAPCYVTRAGNEIDALSKGCHQDRDVG